MGPDTKDKPTEDQDSKYNPGQQYADREFNDLTKNYHSSTADPSEEDANIDKLRNAESGIPTVNSPTKMLKDREKEGVGQKAAGSGMAKLATGMGGIGGVAAKGLQYMMGHRRSGALVALITIIIILVVLNLASPLAILVAIKEVLSRFPLREAEIGYNKKILKHTKTRMLGFPECKGNAIKCRHQKGMKKGDIDRMKKAGFTLEEPYKRGKKQFFRTISYVDTDGKKVSINANNFDEVMRTNPVARAKLNKFITSRSLILRSAAALKKWAKLGIDRVKGGVGDDKDTKESRIKKMREYIYTKLSLDKLRRGPTVSNTDEEGKPRPQADNANQVYDRTTQDVDRINREAREGRQRPEDRANLRGMSETDPNKLKTAGKGALATVKGGLKGLFTGIFTSVDAYCTVYQIVRMVSLTAKVLVAAQLIRYAFIFLTIADQAKAGDAETGGAMSFLAGFLLQPSTEPESIGKTFSDGPGWVAATQGAVIDREAMGRFVTGGAIMLFFNRVKKLMEVGGVSPQTCKHIKSWYGQAGIIIGGLIGSLATWGGGAVAGVAMGAAFGLLQMIIMKYAIPFISQAAAGTISPDPNDPLGGYAAGTAIPSGAAEANGQGVLANGGTFMNHDQQVAILKNNIQEEQTAIAAEHINNREMGIFSPNNPNNFQNKFALAMLPYISTLYSKNNLASGFLSAGQLIQGAVATIPNMFSRTAGALEGVDPNSVNFYRGDACPDEINAEANLVQTATCARVTKASGAAYNDMDIEKNRQWLQDRGYLDKDWQPTGDTGGDDIPKSDTIKSYESICKENAITEAVSQDGLGIDGVDNGSAKCFDDDPKYDTYMSGYLEDENISTTFDQISDGTFGQGEGGGGQTNETDSGKLAEGTPQELAKAILESGKVTFGRDAYKKQIQDIADGKANACHVNPTILAYLATMSKDNKFRVSSLNRKCVNNCSIGAGNASYHCREKGGHAVDFDNINGAGATGNTSQERKFVEDSIKLLPKGSGFGQKECRKPPIKMPSGFREFLDPCNHLHVQVPVK